MQISCSQCNAHYSLTAEELARLPQSIFVCKSCRTFIKIILCPTCQSSYSISFRASQNERYRLRCRRCDNSFTIDFPEIHDGIAPGMQRAAPAPAPAPAAPARTITRTQGADASVRTLERPRETAPARTIPVAGEYRRTEAPRKPAGPVVFKGLTFNDFSLKELSAVAISALTPMKLAIAALGIALSVFLVFVLNLSGLNPSAVRGETIGIVRLAAYIAPTALLLIVFVFTSALIARATLDTVFKGSGRGPAGMASFAARSIPQAVVNSGIMLLLANVVVILLGAIPMVGPVMYALLFIPAYLISFLVILALVIGVWFYPPIVAYREPGILKNAGHLFHFIKRHNLGLIPASLTLFVTTGFLCAIAYLLHWGAFSLTLRLSRGILPQETGKIFASVPSAFVRISDMLQGSPDRGVFVSVIGDLIFSHHVGGVLLGASLVLISLALFASALSLSGTLSTHVYLMMERDLDLDDRKKIRMLAVIVLLLAGALLVKKLLW
jgi:hypothetical protein